MINLNGSSLSLSLYIYVYVYIDRYLLTWKIDRTKILLLATCNLPSPHFVTARGVSYQRDERKVFLGIL